MPSTKDKSNRPVVVVTGMGVVTSLGAGQADNWAKLTAGQSGITSISRFPTDGLKTRIAGTVDFVPVETLSTPALSERLAEMVAEEAIGEAGIGRYGDFPGPLFLAVPPIEVEWPQRLEVAGAARGNDAVDYAALLRACGTGQFSAIHGRLISSVPRARRSRCRRPARRVRPQSSSASRRSGAANPMQRFVSVATDRSTQNR
jgi:3-oxoacyl-[acyl-carrier-protein] synthase II